MAPGPPQAGGSGPAPSWSPADVLGPQEPVLPILGRPPGMIGDLDTGTLDLSLPSDDALMTAARPNPERAHDQIRTGRPANITAFADRFARAGAGMDESYDHSEATQRQLAGAFANDGTSVYDRDTHFAALPRDYRDTGTRQYDIARRLTVTADELTTTQTLAADTVTTLREGLHQQRVAWAGEVDAARNPAGLIPYAAIAGLAARRTTIAAIMQNDTDTAGTTIATAIGHIRRPPARCPATTGRHGPQRRRDRRYPRTPTRTHVGRRRRRLQLGPLVDPIRRRSRQTGCARGC